MKRYRRSSLFVNASEFGRPLSRDERHRILWLAERLALRRVQGRRSHLISPYTLQVLRVLLSFVGKDGSCCPSLTTLQERAGFCRNTVLKAIRQLEACRLLAKCRRIVRRAVERVNGLTGRSESVVLPVQTSNAYRFSMAAVAAPVADPAPIERSFKPARTLSLWGGVKLPAQPG